MSPKELEELRKRTSQQSDQDLLRIVNVDFKDYRQEMIDLARAELQTRGVLQSSGLRQSEQNEKPVVPLAAHRARDKPKVSEKLPGKDTSTTLITIECRFCGHLISATAMECEKCGGGTAYGVEIESTVALSALDKRQKYEYRMVQIPPNIKVDRRGVRGNEAALYLQQIVNEPAKQGWEFVRVDTIGVQIPPGCLAGLFGGQVTTLNYYVVTFRNDRRASSQSKEL